MRLLFWGFVVVVVFALARRGLMGAARRGWIYYGDIEPPPGTGSRAVSNAMTVFMPELEHVIEEEVSGEMRDLDDLSAEPSFDEDP